MSVKIVKDLAVVTGSFKDNTGSVRKNWLTIGSIVENDKGEQYILLKSYVNLAALPRPGDSDAVTVSCFMPRPKGVSPHTPPPPGPIPKYADNRPKPDDLDDDIPF